MLRTMDVNNNEGSPETPKQSPGTPTELPNGELQVDRDGGHENKAFIDASGRASTETSKHSPETPTELTNGDILRRRIDYPGGHVNGGYRGERRASAMSLDILKGSRLSAEGKQLGLAKRLQNRTVEDTQRFSEKDKKVLAKFSSVNYQPSHHQVYLDWLAQQPTRTRWQRWFLIILIGVTIGLLCFILKNCLQVTSRLRWTQAKQFASEGDLGMTTVWVMCFSVLFVVIGSSLIVFVHPPAGGSGVPETISFLNGVVVHGTLSLKCLVIKFLGNVFAVSSGLPCAIQGPVIAMGAIIGAGIGQFRSKTLGFNPSLFSQFRSAEDRNEQLHRRYKLATDQCVSMVEVEPARYKQTLPSSSPSMRHFKLLTLKRRSFTTAGVAAGVAAGFNAPIGGLLFAMEDLSSFWSRRLCWETFFCSGVAAATANMFNTAFVGFTFQGVFGLFKKTIQLPHPMSVLSFGPAILLGLTGGVLGALFTRMNAYFCATRKSFLAKFKNQTAMKCARVMETVIYAVIMACFVLYLPLGFECTTAPISTNLTRLLDVCKLTDEFERAPYMCDTNSADPENNLMVYDEVATLVQDTSPNFVDHLTSRGTHRWFSYGQMLSILPIWYFMTCLVCGSAISGGIFIPILISGALYGRVLGLGLCDLWSHFNDSDIPTDQEWAWMDPGVLAVIGAASLLGGTTRMTLAVTVIVVEMEQDIDLTIPVLVAVFVAKVIADIGSEPLWKYQLHSKALPYLTPEPVVNVNGIIVNLENFHARDVMVSPVVTMHATETVAYLATMLLKNDHGAYPVVKYNEATRNEHMHGIITRIELYVILCSDMVYESKEGDEITPEIDYQNISVDYIVDPSAAEERLKMYTKFQHVYEKIKINLEPFVNMSAAKIDNHFSLLRTYNAFRTMGLCHMTVVNKTNQVVGVITRKDLMSFNIEEKLIQRAEEEVADIELGILSPPLPIFRSVSSGKLYKHEDSIQEGDESGEHDGDSDSTLSVKFNLPKFPNLTPTPIQEDTLL